MSSIPVELNCPFGHKCEDVKDGAIHRCMLYTKVVGHNPNTGEQMDYWNCALSSIPILLIENSQQQRSTGAAVESFRNQMVEANAAMLQMAERARLEKL